MNKEAFEKLSLDKKRRIEEAYVTASKREITPSDFFDFCKKILTDEEFEVLFNKTEKPREQEEIKTEYLQDILQYSGVDLKEEADQIVKETEHNIGYYNYDDEDANNQMYSLLNVKLFKEYIQKLGKSRGVFVSEDSYFLLFQVLKRKLIDVIEKMDEASKIRVEYNISDYVVKINNDLTRQFWCLEQIEKSEMDKLMISKGDDENKKKVKKQIHEREDLLVKKRLSNTVAMAALGIQQKSWMSGEESEVSKEATKFKSIYGPYDEKQTDRKIMSRVITMKDFIYVLERDKRYNKSVFIIQHYFK